MAPFLYIIFYFQIILNNIISIQKKNKKTKTPKLKLKIKWTTFCEIHTKILLEVDGKVPQRGVTIVCFHPSSLD